MRKSIFLIFALFCCLNAFAAPDPNFHVYIAFGQSNMQGAPNPTATDKVPNARFKVLASMNCPNMQRSLGQWATAVPPLFHCSSGLSPADYFGKTLVESLPEVTVGIIPVAIAGTSIKLFDKNQYQNYLATAESWLKNISADYGPSPYARIIDLGKEAQKVGVIKGFIMHQGETDGGYGDWEKIVKKVYNDFLSDLGLSADSAPLLVGEMLSPGACSGMNSRVNQLPKTIPTAHVVSSVGCTGASDNLHFDNAGVRELGKRYAQVMLPLLKTTIVDVPQEPYGKTHVLPGLIEVEDYDLGGQNKAYYDNDIENQGGKYRTDGVDIVAIDNGYAIGYTEAGEWLEYTIKIEKEDIYNVEARIASGSDNSSFRLFLDDKAITDTIKVANGGDWETYSTLSSVTSRLSAGTHVLKLAITGSYVNLDWLKFSEGTTGIANPLHIVESNGLQKFTVYDFKGRHMGTFKAFDMPSLKSQMQKSNVKAGVYMVRPLNGKQNQLVEVK